MKKTAIMLAGALAMTTAGAAAHAAIIDYSFSPGTTYSFNNGGPSYTLTGGFSFDTSDLDVTKADVLFHDPAYFDFTFTSATASSNSDITLSNDGFGDLIELNFAKSLANGGVDAISGNSYSNPEFGDGPTSETAVGSVVSPSTTSVSAVPEPVTWAMMIGGFGLVGGLMRRAHRKSEEDFTRKVRSLATA